MSDIAEVTTKTKLSDRIEMWERIHFMGQEPVAWERSWDQGKTWEPVHWFGDGFPFILFKPVDPELFESKV